MKEKELRKMVREELNEVLGPKPKSSKLKDLMTEGLGMTFIHCPPAIGGTSPSISPFGKKQDNFKFKGLPGRVKANTKLNESNMKILDEITSKLSRIVEETKNLYLDEALELMKKVRG